jgi:hypothetical protein
MKPTAEVRAALRKPRAAWPLLFGTFAVITAVRN